MIGILKAQDITPLYPAGIPNSTTDKAVYLDENVPKLYGYLPQKGLDKHVGVLIIPGGGYAMIAMDHEGHDVAKALISHSYTAFVLRSIALHGVDEGQKHRTIAGCTAGSSTHSHCLSGSQPGRCHRFFRWRTSCIDFDHEV